MFKHTLLYASLFSVVALTGCNAGFTLDEDEDDVDSLSFFGAADDSYWELELDLVDEDFTLTKSTAPTDSTSASLIYSLSGSYSEGDNGLTELFVESSDDEAIDSDTEIFIVYAEDHAAFIFPFDEVGDDEEDDISTQVVALIKHGGEDDDDEECPIEDISDLNYIRYQFGSEDDANKSSEEDPVDFVGKYTYGLNTETIELTEAYDLRDLTIPLDFDRTIQSDTCSDGLITPSDNDVHYLSDNNSSIITEFDDAEEERIFIALQPLSLSSLSSISDTYLGFIGSEFDGVTNITETRCSFSTSTDISTCVVREEGSDDDLYTMLFSSENVNSPSLGMIHGTINITGLDDTYNIACHANTDVDTEDDDEGTKLMVCVGQTPEDPSIPMNLFLVSPE